MMLTTDHWPPITDYRRESFAPNFGNAAGKLFFARRSLILNFQWICAKLFVWI